MPVGTEDVRLRLLLRRGALGVSPEEAARYAALGFDGALDELLHPEMIDENFEELLQRLQGHLVDLTSIADVQTWWLYQLVRTRRPLQEKLTLFWHGHFAVANTKVQNPTFMHQHLALLRSQALGSFRDLLLGVSRDPAMLIWLDGGQNRKAAPNENYGRELLELFTLGIGHYDEVDVQSAARAFTGWTFREGAFFFDANQHDNGPKTFLGQTGNFDGGQIVERVVSHEATAERLCRKLFAFFAYPNPEPEVLQPFTRVYLQRNAAIGPVVEAILRSDAFISDRSVYGHVKSPVEMVVGAVRELGAQVGERALFPALQGMGQDLLNPPNVAGWAGDRAWVNPSTLLARFNFAGRLATARGENNDGGLLDAARLLGVKGDMPDPATLVDRLTAVLGGLELAPEARQALADYLGSPLTYPAYVTAAPNPQQKQQAMDARLRGAIQLALSSSDYQIG